MLNINVWYSVESSQNGLVNYIFIVLSANRLDDFVVCYLRQFILYFISQSFLLQMLRKYILNTFIGDFIKFCKSKVNTISQFQNWISNHSQSKILEWLYILNNCIYFKLKFSKINSPCVLTSFAKYTNFPTQT